MAASTQSASISNGFAWYGGVALSSQHVLGDVSALGLNGVGVVMAGGKTYSAGVVKRSADMGILLAQNAALAGAKVGSSGELAAGAKLFAMVPDQEGKGKLLGGAVTGWRTHEAQALIETDMEMPKQGKGAGVFGPDGRLVGLLSFTFGHGLTYVLPIEYLACGPGALTAGVVKPCEAAEAFTRRAQEAQTQTAPLLPPPTFDTVVAEPTYSRTALVGRVPLLDKSAGSTAHSGPIHFRLEAADMQRKRRVIAEGLVDAANQQWALLPAVQATLASDVAARFGPDFVTRNISPYVYGELRFRIPFNRFCAKVTGEETHVMNLKLADGRKPPEIAFADLVNICAAIEDGDGTALEKEWGMSAAPPAKKPVKAGKRGKGGKKKR